MAWAVCSRIRFSQALRHHLRECSYSIDTSRATVYRAADNWHGVLIKIVSVIPHSTARTKVWSRARFLLRHIRRPGFVQPGGGQIFFRVKQNVKMHLGVSPLNSLSAFPGPEATGWCGCRHQIYFLVIARNKISE